MAPDAYQKFNQPLEGYADVMLEPDVARSPQEVQVGNEGGIDNMVMTTRKVTLDAAGTVISAARQRAQDIGVPMNIAVVDEGNNLVAFARMDGAWLGSIDIARGKAYTARAFDMGTGDLAPLAQPGQPLYGIDASNQGQIIVFPGGVPLKADDTVVGAVGVSGGAVDQDQQVAEAGAAAFPGATR